MIFRQKSSSSNIHVIIDSHLYSIYPICYITCGRQTHAFTFLNYLFQDERISSDSRLHFTVPPIINERNFFLLSALFPCDRSSDQLTRTRGTLTGMNGYIKYQQKSGLMFHACVCMKQEIIVDPILPGCVCVCVCHVCENMYIGRLLVGLV